jgi:hypothetical protein
MLPIAARFDGMASIRDVAELTSVDRPAWPRLQALVESSTVGVTVLPIDSQDGERVLYRLQVTTRSPLGALALHTGGLVVDHGWLRVLGGGSGGLMDLAQANQLSDPSPGRPAPDAMVFAYDVLGGRFALNGGALPGGRGEVCYWGPDTLEWTPLGLGHGAFLEWALAGGLDRFCAELRWTGWEQEVEPVALSDGLACFPFLFSAEGRDITQTTRTPVPFAEILLSHDDLARQLAEVSPNPAPAPPPVSSFAPFTHQGESVPPAGQGESAAPAERPPLRRPWRENRLPREYSLPQEYRLPRDHRFRP